MKYNSVLRVLTLAAALIGASCRSDLPVPPEPYRRPELSGTDKTVIASANEFGLSLFRHINGLEKGRSENIFISPLSVSTALGMTLNGAARATLDSMKHALGLSGLNNEQINTSYQTLTGLLTSLDPGVAFRIANSIWYRSGATVNTDFLAANRKYFDADVSALDFSAPGAADAINAWVSAKTNNRIRTIVASPIDAATVMFLVNAMYFKGTWTYLFDSTLTRQQPFTRSNASPVTVPLMHQSGKYLYYQNDQFQMADLPYGNGDFRMTVLLPHAASGIDDLVGAADARSWAGWIAQLDSMKGVVELPRFKIDYELQMKPVLSLLGMGIAFSPDGADFSRIDSLHKLFISSVKHKSFVEVNEQGTEAAAATVVEIGTTSYPPPNEQFMMRIDHPFLFVIRDAPSGTILFIGKIGNPLQ